MPNKPGAMNRYKYIASRERIVFSFVNNCGTVQQESQAEGTRLSASYFSLFWEIGEDLARLVDILVVNLVQQGIEFRRQRIDRVLGRTFAQHHEIEF